VEFAINVDVGLADANSVGLEESNTQGETMATMQMKGSRLFVVTSLGDLRATSAELAASKISLDRRRRLAVLGRHKLPATTPKSWKPKGHVTITRLGIIYAASPSELVRKLT
jgi:hypothetical protein